MDLEVEAMSHVELKAQWIKLIGRPPPVSCSAKFLKCALAFETQSKVSMGLSKAELKTLAASLSHGDKPATTKTLRAKTKLVPGSQLLRDWNGRTYNVTVIEEGFIYREQIWSSLSAIARDITGAHWSGPRFFGINGEGL